MTNGKIKDVLRQASEKISNLDARVLLKAVLLCDEIYLAIHSDEMLSDADFEKYCKYILRREKNEPVAYITNSKEFMGLSFYVDENVLIPRWETELIVEKIIESDIKKEKILDLCTGSGAIAVSLAKYIENADVTGVDISEKALFIAKKNAKSKNVRFRLCDVLCDIKNIGEMFDIVVSNPPYIERDVIETLDSDVKDYEPHIALDGGSDGLYFYRKIIEDIGFVLKKDGYLFFEIGYNQADSLKELMSEKFSEIVVINDLANHPRVVCGRYIG